MTWQWDRLLTRHVIVNLKEGGALRGLLVRQQRGLLWLAQAELLESRQQPVGLDGEVVVQRENITFIQVLP